MGGNIKFQEFKLFSAGGNADIDNAKHEIELISFGIGSDTVDCFLLGVSR